MNNYIIKKARANTDILSAILMKKVITHTILTKKKNVLLSFDKKEINDEIIRSKKIDIYGKLFFSFFIWRKCDMPNVNFYLSTRKRFL